MKVEKQIRQVRKGSKVKTTVTITISNEAPKKKTFWQLLIDQLLGR